MKRLILTVLCCAAFAMPVSASEDDIIRRAATGDVPATMDALVAAVESAGATVFARVDHTAGAESVGMEMTDAQLLLFGNPKLGTPAMQDNPLAGLYLPLRVLVYRDDAGTVWLAYDDPKDMLAQLGGISEEAAYIGKMRAALEKLTTAAAGN